MEVIPTQNMPVQRLKVAILPLDLPCSGIVTHSREVRQVSQEKAEKWLLDCKKPGWLT